MIDLSSARLTTLAVHKVGNKAKNEGVVSAKELFELDESMTDLLQDYFLKPFKSEEFFKFSHESDINLNELYTYCKRMFTDSREEFLSHSINVLQHLYSVSVHPHIKSGELYVAHFRECEVDGVDLEAIGIFKSENKDVFLKVDGEDDEINMTAEQGINIKKLDKGCLVFRTYEEDGYSILMVDKSSEDAAYWRDDFLHVTRIQDNSFQTEHFMGMTKDFCEDIFAMEQDKKEQVVFLNKSLNYFNKNKEFDLEDFKEEVLVQDDYKEKFDSYRKAFEDESGLPPAEEGFAISKYAVRSMKKNFKSLIKLDTDIEIRLNPKNIEEASEYVERAYDEQRGMYYYKLYFNGEIP
ncbi:MAG: nucleoid-associated protein [Bacteroidia bacterium]|nr:nucleoid-associated protein [Bacteroidia bacterium]